MDKKNGTIEKIVREKGFGFIKGDDGVERFFHRSAVSDPVSFEGLSEHDKVSFVDEAGGDKGPRARDVRLAT